jgi:hypothetical protein
MKVHQKSVPLRLQLAPGDSIVSVVASKRRHARYTPQVPLAMPEVDLEKIVKKGNLSREGFSCYPRLKSSIRER